jgi:hypothetical protein
MVRVGVSSVMSDGHAGTAFVLPTGQNLGVSVKSKLSFVTAVHD